MQPGRNYRMSAAIRESGRHASFRRLRTRLRPPVSADITCAVPESPMQKTFAATTSNTLPDWRTRTDRPRDLRDLVDHSAEALQGLRRRPGVERDGVLDTGRAPLVVEAAVSLDRYALHLDAKPRRGGGRSGRG